MSREAITGSRGVRLLERLQNKGHGQVATKKKPTKKRVSSKKSPKGLSALIAVGWRWIKRAVLAVLVIFIVWIALYSVVPVFATPYMAAERMRYGPIEREWMPIDDMAPVIARSVVAAEDANFCNHWGFDMSAIRDAISDGATRGASTISQQVTKNAFLWHGRSWLRKALEAALTPVVELLWSKSRVLEVYLNVAEFDAGVFGVAAASRHYYGITAAELSPMQAARLAVLLPNPKARAPDNLSVGLQQRAAQIADGAETIRRDGRAACFED